MRQAVPGSRRLGTQTQEVVLGLKRRQSDSIQVTRTDRGSELKFGQARAKMPLPHFPNLYRAWAQLFVASSRLGDGEPIWEIWM